jgi:hypothetical protein
MAASQPLDSLLTRMVPPYKNSRMIFAAFALLYFMLQGAKEEMPQATVMSRSEPI